MRNRDAMYAFGLAVLVASAATAACGMADGPPAAEAETPGTLEEHGETLFTEETFDGNDRVCSTCHEPDPFGTITPEFVQEQFALDPEGPLFRAIDSDDGEGDSYERLLERATIRVPFELPYDEVLGRAIRRCDAPEQDSVVVAPRQPERVQRRARGGAHARRAREATSRPRRRTRS